MGELRMYIKQAEQYDVANGVVHYESNNGPQDLHKVVGALWPADRRWRNYGDYIDVTGDVGNLQTLTLTWTQDRNTEGVSTPGAFNGQKSASGSLSVEGEAYELIKKWLIEDVSAPLNAVAVKVYDSGCGITYDNYVIQAKDIRYCESEICNFDISLKQKDEQLNCIKSTLIADDHQGWFPSNGRPQNKKHPRFSYCNEQRPNGMMVAIWRLGMFNFMFTNTILVMIVPVVNTVLAIINFFKRIFGGKKIKLLDFKDILATQHESFVNTAGCGREHPAPLIRDYIQNVCDKCGIQVDAASAPIFFARDIDIETSTRGMIHTQNPHYTACYFNAPVQRGIMRAELHSPFRAPDFNDTDFWIPDNAPLLTLDMFLDELKPLYNAEWRVINSRLYFNRKDAYLDDAPKFDFSRAGADRNKLVEGVCFEWNEKKYPVATTGLYTADPVDTCGNEAQKHYDGTVNFGLTDDNPNFEGLNRINVNYSAAKFRFDGASRDYIYDAAQQVNNSELFTGILTLFSDTMRKVLDRIPEYCLLLKDETAGSPKILIWDGENYLSARCTRLKSAYDPNNGFPLPTPNVPYNNWQGTKQWWQIHEPITFVQGSNFNPYNYPDGYYTVRKLYSTIIGQAMAILTNYPMYFAHEFEDGMWDWFHWIDDPNRNPKMNQNWNLKMELCCEDVADLGVKDDAAGIILGQKIKLPAKYYGDGVIKEITLSYDTKNNKGAYIELKGTN
jgi:hypothetical protein